jgi:hypothetical protein
MILEIGGQMEVELLNEKSEMLKRINGLTAKFSSNEDAVRWFSIELESLASRYSLNVSDFLTKAELSVEHNDDYLLGLSLSKKILFLRK